MIYKYGGSYRLNGDWHNITHSRKEMRIYNYSFNTSILVFKSQKTKILFDIQAKGKKIIKTRIYKD